MRCHCGKVKGRNFKEPVTSCLLSGTERNIMVTCCVIHHPCMGTIQVRASRPFLPSLESFLLVAFVTVTDYLRNSAQDERFVVVHGLRGPSHMAGSCPLSLDPCQAGSVWLSRAAYLLGLGSKAKPQVSASLFRVCIGD